MLEDRTVHRRREVKGNYLFQGVLQCPNCGKNLSVNRYLRKRSDGTEYQSHTYRCQPCEKEGTYNKAIGEKRILDALYRYMANVKIDHLDQIEEKVEKPIFIDQLKQIEKKREKYQRAWAADNMTDEEFQKLMNETRKPYEELKKKVEEYREPTTIDKEALKEIVYTFNDNFKELTTDEQKTFISTFIRSIKFELIPQRPSRPDKSKRGKDIVSITDIEFY